MTYEEVEDMAQLVWRLRQKHDGKPPWHEAERQDRIVTRAQVWVVIKQLREKRYLEH